MSVTLAQVALWVHDQDEALAFYTERLGFELREDARLPEFPDYRWLTVGPPGQPDVALLLNVPAPPMFDEETCRQILTMVAQGKMGGFLLNCDDCQATYEEMRERGVEFQQPPTRQPYGIDAAFRDPSGNQARLVQRVPIPA